MAHRILIVEDARPVSDVICDFLEDEGYLCEVVGDGKEAIELLKSKVYDLILTDLRLPGASGFEVVEAANQTHPKSPKIIMTAYTDMDDALRAIRLGAYDFIQKPIRNLWELSNTVQHALEHLDLLRDQERHQVEMEAMNERLELEVKRRTEALFKANNELRTLDEMKNNLLANLSHELCTPLNAARGFIKLLHVGALGEMPKGCEPHLESSLRSLDKLHSLITSLLRYAELGEQGKKLELEQLDLKLLLESLVKDRSAAVEQKQLAIDFHVRSDSCCIKADRSLLVQALEAILDNAIQFSPEQGTVTIELTMVSRELLQFAILDEGCGIAKEQQSRIFERFYQVDATRTREHGGTGMGLTIARDNLRLHGTELMVQSKLGEGSAFFFTFPISREV